MRWNGTMAGGTGRREQGQSLILAVIVILLLVLIGSLFVLSLAGNIQNTERGTETVKTRSLADAGIEYADRQIVHGPQGVDWRPPPPPLEITDTPQLYWDEYEMLRGWHEPSTHSPVGVPFTKFPSPGPDVEATDEPPIGDEGYFLLKVEYIEPPNPQHPEPAPWSLADLSHAPALKITAIGRSFEAPFVHHTRVVYKPIGLTRYLWFVTNRDRDTRPTVLGMPNLDFNGQGVPGQRPFYDLDGDGQFDGRGLGINGGVRVNGDLIWSGMLRILLDPAFLQRVEVAGEIRHGVGTPQEVRVQSGPTDIAAFPSRHPRFNALQGAYRDHFGPLVGDPDRYTFRLEAASLGIEDRDPVTGRHRWEELTRYSGQPLAGSFTSGEFGFGDGIFIANGDQRQSLEAVREEWLRVVDSPNWPDLHYAPPGVEIVLYPVDLDETGESSYPDNPGDWDDPSLPDLRVFRRNSLPGNQTIGAWRFGPDGLPLTIGGVPSVFEYLDLDYPANGVIYAEGNVRIRGTLAPGHSLTVVAGGSIYIEGNVLRPSDLPTGDPLHRDLFDPGNGRVALLARDHVVVNPTRLAAYPNTPSGGNFYTIGLNDVNVEMLRFSLGRPISAGACWLTTIHGSEFGSQVVVTVEADANRNGRFGDPPPQDVLMNFPLMAPGGTAGEDASLFWRGHVNISSAIVNEPGVEHRIRFSHLAGSPYLLKNAKIMALSGDYSTGLDLLINGLLFAERGQFFMIPGHWFDTGERPRDLNFGRQGLHYARYNHGVTIQGAIVMNRFPALSDLGDWTNKWAQPIDSMGMLWSSVNYRYDPGLLGERAGNRLILPFLPASSELIDAG